MVAVCRTRRRQVAQDELFDLNTQFIDLGHSAKELGIPLARGNQAQRAAAQQLIKQNIQDQRGVYTQIASLRGDNSLGTQMFNLRTQVNELYDAAGTFGISLKYVTDAWNTAQKDLVRQNTINVRNLYSQLETAGGFGGLKTALFGLETQFMDLYDAAGKLGVPLRTVVDAQTEATRRLIETYDKAIADLQKQQGQLDQQLKEANRSAFQVIDQFLDPLKQATGAFGIGQGIFSQAATAKDGMAEFRKVLQLAQGGDTGALGQLAGVGQQALQAGPGFWRYRA